MATGRSSLGLADYQFLGVAQAALRLPPLKASRTGQFASLMVGVLPNRQVQPFGNAVVANRGRREPRYERANLSQYGHTIPLGPIALARKRSRPSEQIMGAYPFRRAVMLE